MGLLLALKGITVAEQLSSGKHRLAWCPSQTRLGTVPEDLQAAVFQLEVKNKRRSSISQATAISSNFLSETCSRFFTLKEALKEIKWISKGFVI